MTLAIMNCFQPDYRRQKQLKNTKIDTIMGWKKGGVVQYNVPGLAYKLAAGSQSSEKFFDTASF